MTTLKILRDTESAAPTRIKYKGDLVYLGFSVDVTAGDDEPTRHVATLDCLGTKEVEDGDNMAYVDLMEAAEAVAVVRDVEFLDEVRTPFGPDMEAGR